MSAGNPILAYDNSFNSWIIGNDAVYFKNAADCNDKLTKLLGDKEKLQAMGQNSFARYCAEFASDRDLKSYEKLFLSLSDRTYFLSTKKNNYSKVESVVQSR